MIYSQLDILHIRKLRGFMENKKSKSALVFAILAIGLSIYISKTGVDTYSSIWSLFPPVVAIFIALLLRKFSLPYFWG